MLTAVALGAAIGVVIAAGAIVIMLEAEKFELGLAEYP